MGHIRVQRDPADDFPGQRIAMARVAGPRGSFGRMGLSTLPVTTPGLSGGSRNEASCDGRTGRWVADGFVPRVRMAKFMNRLSQAAGPVSARFANYRRANFGFTTLPCVLS